MKKLMLTLSALLILLSLCACKDQKENIRNLVINNQELLLQYITEGEAEKASEISGIESVYSRDGYTEFICSDSGMGSQTSYYGFCYIESDDLALLPPHEWQEDGKTYSSTVSDGDNKFYAEKLCDKFYYYEQHY